MASDDRNTESFNYKAITCWGIPELFLDKLTAKKHFSRFGKVNRFILRPKRLTCTVEYETVEDAERACLAAGEYNGHEFLVEYAKHEVAHVQNTEEWIDPDVQAELEAMNPSLAPRYSAASITQRQSAALPPPAVLAAPPPPAAKLPTMRAPKPSTGYSASSRTAKDRPTEQQPPPVAHKIDAAVRNELEAILRRPALSEEEKYRVLDARDKLIRLKTVRQTDITKAVSTRGTCPDMCPEKERLMREFQRQVSSFETDGNATISQRRAIKEYSRSSADQEVPLHHELRSESVLQMTMLYLMHRIMDLCDDPQVSLADWFHFVWDRTRSIRKDITQQELCSLGAVELVEQCARFHIHCAARLVAEDPSVFDKKINAENLTKCLQTLKYMYHDLRIKNVPCPCEAEFRSYVVLLNLGDSNFLWELKQLPEHIQNSHEIKRAVAIYNALQHNNYVRFFDMIRSPATSYLSACILLMYFNKLRLRAMKVIYKSHNWRKNATILPLAHLAHVLAFESTRAAAQFFSSHGWQCDERLVKLDQLQPPEFGYSMERALELVESKRTVTVGECICGQPLQDAAIFEQHQPHNSFDANGLLRFESWTAEDQLRGDAAVERKRVRQEMEIQKQQQQEIAPQTLPFQRLPPPAYRAPAPAPPTIKTDHTNLFKVPLASAPISPKQQQQRQPQQALIFGANNTTAGRTATQQSIFSTASAALPANNASTNDSRGLFGQKPSFGAAASDGNSLFANASATPSIVFGNATGSGNFTAAAPNDGKPNIFGKAAKETANIFQHRSTQQLPPSFGRDNVFQHFGDTASTNFTSAPPPSSSPFAPPSGHSIFGGAASETQHQQLELARQRAEKEQLQRQLEEEHTRQLQQLEEERRKLKQLEQERAAQLEASEREVRLQQAAAAATEQHFKVVLAEEIRNIASAELTKSREFDAMCQTLTQQLIANFVTAEINELVNEEYAVMCYDQMLLQRYMERWQQYTRKRLEQRQLISQTPVWAIGETLEQQADQLQHPTERQNMALIRRYRHGSPANFKRLLATPEDALVRERVDPFQIVQQCSGGAPSAGLKLRKYFKLLISLPEEREELPGFESLCNRWLRKYVAQPGSVHSSGAFICALQRDVALCVRKVSGVNARNEAGRQVRHECDYADAVIFVMSCSNVNHTRQRLHRLLKLAQFGKSVPLAVVAYDAEEIAEHDLRRVLAVEGLLSTAEGKVFFERALRFVANAAAKATTPMMAMQSLPDWLATCLGEEMWRRWQYAEQHNPAFAKICNMPQHIVGLHNEALERLRQMVGHDWQLAPEFPRELRDFVPCKGGVGSITNSATDSLEYFPADWKSPERTAQLEKFLAALRMPSIEMEQVKLNTDVEAWQLWLLNYAGRCIPRDEAAATTAAFESIRVLIDQLNAAELRDLAVSERLRLVSFLPVMRELVFGHMNSILADGDFSHHLPGEVFYSRTELKAYLEQPWWLNCQPMQAVTVDYTLPDESAAGRLWDESRVAEEQEQQLEEMQTVLAQAQEISRRAEENMTNVLRQQKLQTPLNSATLELKRELDESLYQFEVAKQIGAYDVSYAIAQVDSLDSAATQKTEPNEGASFIESTHQRKRKHFEVAQQNTDVKKPSEMDLAMAKALALIERVEVHEDDRQRRLHKAAKWLESSSPDEQIPRTLNQRGGRD